MPLPLQSPVTPTETITGVPSTFPSLGVTVHVTNEPFGMLSRSITSAPPAVTRSRTTLPLTVQT
jgi:hypothetical protein